MNTVRQGPSAGSDNVLPEKDYAEQRSAVDIGNDFVRWRLDAGGGQDIGPSRIRDEPSFLAGYVPPAAWHKYPETAMCTKYMHMCIAKTKQAILSLTWTPDGRRILTGSMSGEFGLWNATTFGYEMLMQAHEEAATAISYSKSGEWLISGDQSGSLKVWQPNFNPVHITKAHREAIKGIVWSPSDAKFATASEDSTVKIWSFETMHEEATLADHGWDVKCVDWHPEWSLIASGSKDNVIKLWDPRQAKEVATIRSFKNTIGSLQFQKLGARMLLAAGSKDTTARIFDLRWAQQALVLRGHDSDVLSLAWHPIHPQLLTTGTHSGQISHFLLDNHLPEGSSGMEPALQISRAHTFVVNALAYHPTGHMLASGSGDKSVRFWARARPGDPTALKDRFYNGTPQNNNFTQTGGDDARSELERFYARERERERQAAKSTTIPGLSVDRQ